MKLICIVCGKELKDKQDVMCEECRLKQGTKKKESRKDVIVIC